MLRTDLPSHRRSSEQVLLVALADRDPLALAEACSRTLPVAYAVARRVLPAGDVEALLLAVYTDLWTAPPIAGGLERWMRSRTAELGLAELRERQAPPAVPSICAIAPDLPAPQVTYLDTTERTLAALSGDRRRALLMAHDLGVPSTEQDEPDAGRSLAAALLVLADPDQQDVDADADAGRLADLVLGLLDPDEAAALDAAAGDDAPQAARLQVLRRGRRRIEGLPPTPDLGPRILAAVLTGGGAAQVAAAQPAPAHAVTNDERPDASALGAGLGAGTTADGPDDLPDDAVSALDGEHAETSTEDLTDVATALGTLSDTPAEGAANENHEAPGATGVLTEGDDREDLEAEDEDDDELGENPDDPDDQAVTTRRSAGVRLLQVLGIILLIIGGVGLGLLLGGLAIDMRS